MSKRADLVAYWGGWWIVCFGLWLLLTSTVSVNELVSGAGAAAIAASVAVTPERKAPEASGAWYGLFATLAAIALAAAALFRERLSARSRARMRPALAPLGALRQAHTGLIGDYVVWFTAGLAVLGGLLVVVTR